jgi:hypothetical protein
MKEDTTELHKSKAKDSSMLLNVTGFDYGL